MALDVADRPPVGLWGHDYIAEWDLQTLARSTIDGQRNHGWDFVKFQPRASCFAEAFGASYKASGSRLEPPMMVEAGVRAEGLAELIPLSMEWGPLADQIESIGVVVESLGPDIPVIQTVFSPLMVAGYLIGDDRKALVAELRSRPHLVLTAMNAIAEVLIDFSTRSIGEGAAGIFFAVGDYASRDVMSPDEYEDLVLPYDRKVLEEVASRSRAWFTTLHLCGPNIMHELFQALPHDALSFSVHEGGNPSLGKVVDRSRKAAMGGIDQRETLVKGSPEDAVEQTLEAARENDGRGILIGPGCSVPPRAKGDAIRAVASAL